MIIMKMKKLIAGGILLVVALGGSALAQSTNNRPILTPNVSQYGKAYGEWSAKHWQWLYSLRVNHHPLFDTAGCSTAQSGPVWFLGGTFVVVEQQPGVVIGNATRDCTCLPT
jgi:hypothetical protein